MQRKTTLFSALTALWLVAASTAHAEARPLEMVRDVLAPRGSLRLLVSATSSSETSSTESCALRLTYAVREGAPPRPLLELPNADGLHAVSVSPPARVRRRRAAIILRAERTCEGVSETSDNLALKAPRGPKGARTLKTWAQRFRKRARVSRIQFTRQFSEESFRQLTDLQSSPALPDYVFLAEQPGRISSLQRNGDGPGKEILLDISRLVINSGEQGLLGMAFHPQLTANPFLFVNYIEKESTDTIIARFTLSSFRPPAIDPLSSVEVLRVSQPFPNHNGGQLAFGPDGYLYIGLGDGGYAHDPYGHGQNPTTILGTMLRIDVNSSSEGKAYGIPADNPFVGSGPFIGNGQSIPEEIYAYGFRNPWRYSFDPATGNLWLADVGQGAAEEIDIVKAGGNYGWSTMEGNLCHWPPSDCDITGLELPVHQYTRELGGSITGGYVYRGSSVPNLIGHYLYADFLSGRVWALARRTPPTAPQVIQVSETGRFPSSFGVDANRELYLLDYGGMIYRLEEIPLLTRPYRRRGIQGARGAA